MLVSEWRPELINNIMSYLKQENIRVHVLTFGDETDIGKSWYGTQFEKEKITEELIVRWNNADTNDAFHLPQKNEFIPASLTSSHTTTR